MARKTIVVPDVNNQQVHFGIVAMEHSRGVAFCNRCLQHVEEWTSLHPHPRERTQLLPVAEVQNLVHNTEVRSVPGTEVQMNAHNVLLGQELQNEVKPLVEVVAVPLFVIVPMVALVAVAVPMVIVAVFRLAEVSLRFVFPTERRQIAIEEELNVMVEVVLIVFVNREVVCVFVVVIESVFAGSRALVVVLQFVLE